MAVFLKQYFCVLFFFILLFHVTACLLVANLPCMKLTQLYEKNDSAIAIISYVFLELV